MKARHDTARRGFASDNYAGMHPDVLEALAVANGGHQGAYGADVYTEALQEAARREFGGSARILPVFNGTGANVVALQTVAARWGAVIAAATAHIHVDEGGAPERVGGLKLLTVPTPDGKLTPELVEREAWGFGDVHRAQPAVLSLAQSSELGTVYTVAELRALSDHAHALGMLVHLDGARLFNGAASLGCGLGDMVRAAGVDVISLGGTKNGAMLAEAVVVVTPEVGCGMEFVRKFDMQLASKMRFVSAQLLALLDDDLGLRNAAHANAMAARLRRSIEGAAAAGTITGVEFTQPTQANAVFATLAPGVADALRREFAFYDWDEPRREVRWMCSFDTSEADVDTFVAALRRVCAERPRPSGPSV